MKPEAIFEGDGRSLVIPPAGAIGTKPMAVRRAQARSIIDNFRQKHGLSHHSPQGHTLWIIIVYLEANHILYRLDKSVHGYIVRERDW